MAGRRILACRSWQKRHGQAEWNKAPSMYEMEGALSGHAAPLSPGLPASARRPVSAAPRFLVPVPATRFRVRFPCACHLPGVSPEGCPFPAVEYFYCLDPALRKRWRAIILILFPVHMISTECARLSARSFGYPPAYAQLVHRSPDVTPRPP